MDGNRPSGVMDGHANADILSDLESSFEHAVPTVRFIIEFDMSERIKAYLGDLVREGLEHSPGVHVVQELARNWPLVYARWLVELAGDVYDQGTLWPHVAKTLGREDSDHVGQVLGRLFLRVLEIFRLRQFPGHRYVANIVGHSIVPEHILPTLLKMIEKARRHLPQNATSLTLWNTLRGDATLPYSDKPLRRFFDTGAESGAEYVQTLRKFLENPVAESVSPAVHRAYWSWKTEKRPRSKQSRRSSNPQICTDCPNRPLLVVFPTSPPAKEATWAVRIDGQRVIDTASLIPSRSEGFELAVPGPCREVVVERGGAEVTSARAAKPGIWLFDESGRALSPLWLTPGVYTAVMRKEWQVVEGQVILQDAPWLDDWRAWKVVSINVDRGQWLAIINDTETEVYRAPVVEPLHRITPNGAVCEVQAGSPIGLTYSGDVSALDRAQCRVTIVSPSCATSRRTMPFTGTEPYEIRLDEVSKEIGTHQVTVELPSGTDDTLAIRVIPRFTPRIPPRLLWPRPNGLHRSGTVHLEVSAGTTVADWDRDGETRRYRRTATREMHELEARITGGPEAFPQTIPIRNVWWEWSSPTDQVTIPNAPLHTSLADLNSRRWTLQLWQQPSWQTDLRLTALGEKDGTIVWSQMVRSETSAILNYSSWADAIAQAPGREFHVVAVPRRNHPVGLFTLARIQRPVFSDVCVDFQRNVLQWRGPDPGRCVVTITSSLRGPEACASARSTPWRTGTGWECQLPPVRDPLPLMRIHMQSARHSAAAVTQVLPPDPSVPTLRRVSGDNLDTLANQFEAAQAERSAVKRWLEYRQWWNQSGGHIFPNQDVPGWVAVFRMLPESARVGAFRKVVGPTLRQCLERWFEAALHQRDPEEALILLGFPQWPLGDVPERTAKRLLKHKRTLGLASPMIDWLLLTGTETFDAGPDPSWMNTLFGLDQTGEPVGPQLVRALETGDQSARSYVARVVREVREGDSLSSAAAVGVPVYLPTECPVSPASQRWLHQFFRRLSSSQGFLRQAEHLWADVGTSEQVLMWTACLQRGQAYGLVNGTVDDDVRLYALAVSQYQVAPEAYKQALLQADLVVGLEHIIRLNQEW